MELEYEKDKQKDLYDKTKDNEKNLFFDNFKIIIKSLINYKFLTDTEKYNILTMLDKMFNKKELNLYYMKDFYLFYSIILKELNYYYESLYLLKNSMLTFDSSFINHSYIIILLYAKNNLNKNINLEHYMEFFFNSINNQYRNINNKNRYSYSEVNTCYSNLNYIVKLDLCYYLSLINNTQMAIDIHYSDLVNDANCSKMCLLYNIDNIFSLNNKNKDIYEMFFEFIYLNSNYIKDKYFNIPSLLSLSYLNLVSRDFIKSSICFYKLAFYCLLIIKDLNKSNSCDSSLNNNNFNNQTSNNEKICFYINLRLKLLIMSVKLAWQKASTVNSCLEIAIIYLEKGELSSSREYLGKACSQKDNIYSKYAWLLYGKYCEIIGDDSSAEQVYDKLINNYKCFDDIYLHSLLFKIKLILNDNSEDLNNSDQLFNMNHNKNFDSNNCNKHKTSKIISEIRNHIKLYESNNQGNINIFLYNHLINKLISFKDFNTALVEMLKLVKCKFYKSNVLYVKNYQINYTKVENEKLLDSITNINNSSNNNSSNNLIINNLIDTNLLNYCNFYLTNPNKFNPIYSIIYYDLRIASIIDLYLYISYVLIHTKCYLKAIYYISKVLEIDKLNYNALLYLGNIHFNYENYNMAYSLFKQIDKFYEKNTMTLYKLGLCLFKNNKLVESRDIFLEVLNLDNNIRENYLNIIECSFLLNDYEDINGISSNIINILMSFFKYVNSNFYEINTEQTFTVSMLYLHYILDRLKPSCLEIKEERLVKINILNYLKLRKNNVLNTEYYIKKLEEINSDFISYNYEINENLASIVNKKQSQFYYNLLYCKHNLQTIYNTKLKLSTISYSIVDVNNEHNSYSTKEYTNNNINYNKEKLDDKIIYKLNNIPQYTYKDKKLPTIGYILLSIDCMYILSFIYDIIDKTINVTKVYPLIVIYNQKLLNKENSYFNFDNLLNNIDTKYKSYINFLPHNSKCINNTEIYIIKSSLIYYLNLDILIYLEILNELEDNYLLLMSLANKPCKYQYILSNKDFYNRINNGLTNILIEFKLYNQDLKLSNKFNSNESLETMYNNNIYKLLSNNKLTKDNSCIIYNKINNLKNKYEYAHYSCYYYDYLKNNSNNIDFDHGYLIYKHINYIKCFKDEINIEFKENILNTINNKYVIANMSKLELISQDNILLFGTILKSNRNYILIIRKSSEANMFNVINLLKSYFCNEEDVTSSYSNTIINIEKRKENNSCEKEIVNSKYTSIYDRIIFLPLENFNYLLELNKINLYIEIINNSLDSMIVNCILFNTIYLIIPNLYDVEVNYIYSSKENVKHNSVNHNNRNNKVKYIDKMPIYSQINRYFINKRINSIIYNCFKDTQINDENIHKILNYFESCSNCYLDNATNDKIFLPYSYSFLNKLHIPRLSLLPDYLDLEFDSKEVDFLTKIYDKKTIKLCKFNKISEKNNNNEETDFICNCKYCVMINNFDNSKNTYFYKYVEVIIERIELIYYIFKINNKSELSKYNLLDDIYLSNKINKLIIDKLEFNFYSNLLNNILKKYKLI